jgi:hypothetical protein
MQLCLYLLLLLYYSISAFILIRTGLFTIVTHLDIKRYFFWKESTKYVSWIKIEIITLFLILSYPNSPKRANEYFYFFLILCIFLHWNNKYITARNIDWVLLISLMKELQSLHRRIIVSSCNAKNASYGVNSLSWHWPLFSVNTIRITYKMCIKTCSHFTIKELI